MCCYKTIHCIIDNTVSNKVIGNKIETLILGLAKGVIACNPAVGKYKYTWFWYFHVHDYFCQINTLKIATLLELKGFICPFGMRPKRRNG